jgi:hemin uptake protein HemP
MDVRPDDLPPGTSPAARPDQPAGGPRSIDSATLFGGAQEILIQHSGREYRLRRTRLDKLILTA